MGMVMSHTRANTLLERLSYEPHPLYRDSIIATQGLRRVQFATRRIRDHWLRAQYGVRWRKMIQASQRMAGVA